MGHQEKGGMMKTELKEGTLYCGDCLEILATLPAKSVDLVITSPPYEDSRLYLEDGENLGIARDTEEWVEWLIDVFKACLRVTKGLVALVVGHGKTSHYEWSVGPALLCAALHKEGITQRRPVIYERHGVMGSGGPDWLKARYEWIICATNGGKLPWSENTACGKPPLWKVGGSPSHRSKSGERAGESMSPKDRERLKAYLAEHKVSQREACRQLGIRMRKAISGRDDSGLTMSTRKVYVPPERANPGDIINAGAVGGGNMGSNIATEGEAPFPIQVPSLFIRSFCPKGGVVCDPFCGTGTTIAEAIHWGRKFIGIDLRPSQIELTKRRIKQASKARLFTP